MLKFYSLASGSKGNATIIKSDKAMIQIDCGKNFKYLKNSYDALDLHLEDLDAVIISHGHSDHVSALKVMYNKRANYSYDFYAGFDLGIDQFSIQAFKQFEIKDIKIIPFSLSHDSPNTLGFVIYDNDEKLVYITDTGYLKGEYLKLIENPDYLIIEANHDVTMLMESNRPYYLKQRILGVNGHLNNEDSAEISSLVIGDKTKIVALAHLSEEANDETIALDVFKQQMNLANKNGFYLLCLKQSELFKGEFDEECNLCTNSSTFNLEFIS